MRTLLGGEVLPQGRNEATWDGRDDAGRRVSSGTYFWRVEASPFSATRRMTAIK